MRKDIPVAVAIAIFLAVQAGCGAANEEAPPEQVFPSGPPVVELIPPESVVPNPCRAAIEYGNELAKMRRKFSETHPDVVRLRELADSAKAECFAAAGQPRKPGEWVEKDGVLECEGYMTRRADQDYCAAEIPEDWVPFTFDGKEYYVQPLAERPYPSALHKKPLPPVPHPEEDPPNAR